MERYWTERTVGDIVYQFEAEVDEGLWRVNLHQKNPTTGRWERPLHGMWFDLPEDETVAEALGTYADTWETTTRYNMERNR